MVQRNANDSVPNVSSPKSQTFATAELLEAAIFKRNCERFTIYKINGYDLQVCNVIDWR